MKDLQVGQLSLLPGHHVPNLRGQVCHEVLIMGHHQNCASVPLQRGQQGLMAVEVAERFVQHQKIGVLKGQMGKHQSTLLTTRQGSQGAKDILAA